MSDQALRHPSVLRPCIKCGKMMEVWASRAAEKKHCSMLCRHGALEERFWERVRKTDTCWLWTGRKNDQGYGMVRVGKQRKYAHRYSWEIHNGPIPASEGYHGTCVLHRCDTPACVRPEHLFLGTHAENMLDKKTKGRCNTGDRPVAALGEANHNAKLNVESVREIRRLHQAGESFSSLARRFMVSGPTIAKVVRGHTWGSA